MRIRHTYSLLALAIVAATILAAAIAGSAGAYPTKTNVCTGCHSGAASGTVTATPSTSTPAAGAVYTVAISIGLTSSGNTGYRVAQTNAAGTTDTFVTVYGGPAAQTAWTASMTAPATPGTYYYKVWCVKGSADSTGQAKAALYSITVPAAVPAAALTSLAPNHALTGASVVIAGTNLGSGGTVRFGTSAAPTTAWSATSITATVPASLAAGATTVTVTPTGGAASNALAFTVDAPPAPTATLTSLSPTSGPVGATMTITGANLGASGAVTVAGITAATTAWSATSITCTIPAGLTIGAKDVVVTPTGGAASNALAFTVTVPPAPTAALTSLTPDHALTGASVVIAGANLGSGGTVRFGTAAATTIAWSATSITATVPASLAAGATTVTVTPTGGATSNALSFTVDAPPVPTAALTSLTPDHALTGASVVIAGANLGSGGTVRFGTTAATTTAWSATSITATVPASLAAGATTVTVTPTGGVTSNALAFTVDAPQAPEDTTAPTTTAAGVPVGGWCNEPVTITLAATDDAGGSGVASITYAVDGGTPVTVDDANALVDLEAHLGGDASAMQGAHTIDYHATDDAGNAEAPQTLTVHHDSIRPSTRAPRAAHVRRHHKAVLKYEVRDATPNAGTATVVITIKNRAGKVVKRLRLGTQPVNTPLTARFGCALRAGTYRFTVQATDAAGNMQARSASQTLKVRPAYGS